MKRKGCLLEENQGGKTYMKDMDKIVTELARKAVRSQSKNEEGT